MSKKEIGKSRDRLEAGQMMAKALKKSQAVMNPISGFLKKGDAKRRRHIENAREDVRAALDAWDAACKGDKE